MNSLGNSNPLLPSISESRKNDQISPSDIDILFELANEIIAKELFEFNPRAIILEKENRLLLDANNPAKMNTLTRSFTVKKGRDAIRELNPKKAPGYDLIINQVLQKLSQKEIKFIIL